MENLRESLLELITQTSTNLPPDVRAAMGLALDEETPESQAAQALNIIATNIDVRDPDACRNKPTCHQTSSA